MRAVIDVTDATFEQDVIERSKQVPVVVDFWADWCGPCRQLSPILERLADEAGGDWILAKIDVDANPGVSRTFGIQGIPAVHAFKDGQRVAEFVGALPEAQVRAWLAQLGPSKADLLVEEARAAEERGDPAAALAAYRLALSEEPGRMEAKAAIERLELAERTASADGQSMAARVAADPLDLDAVKGLADLRFAAGDVDAATDLLVEVVRRGDGEAKGAARAHLVRLLDTLAPDDARAMRARRTLANALF